MLIDSELFTAPANNANDFAEQIKTAVSMTLDKLAPIQTCNRRPSKNITRWLSPEASQAKKERRRLERKWKRSGLEEDRQCCRRHCRFTNKLINESRSSYFHSQLESAKNPRDRWRISQHLLHSKDTVNFQRSDHENQLLCSNFAVFFVNKINELKCKIARCCANLVWNDLLLDSDCSGSTFNDLPPVTYLEVFNLLKSMVPKSSPMDFIPTPLMVSCSDVFSHLIAHLANLSFAEGCFPSCFKSALVTPLLKKPNLDPGNLSNFRPISNLNNISKILERLFLTRIRNHITYCGCDRLNKKISSVLISQLVYREGYSTETALISTLDNIFSSIDNGKACLSVCLNLSAAFDTVDHQLLLSKLTKSFGVCGTA